MALSALDIITAALEKLQVYSPGETLSSADAQRCFSELNSMLDAWGSEFLFVNQLVPVAATLVVNQAQYSIGPSGNVAVARPSKVQYGPAQASVTISAVKTPVNVVSAVEWKFLEDITPGIGTPNTLWYDNQYPLGFLNVSPTPNHVGALTFNSKTPLSSFPDLVTQLSLGIGVQDALQDNLALQIQPYFLKSQLSQEVVGSAIMGKRLIRYQGVTSRAMFARMDRGGAQMLAPPSNG